MQKTNNENRNFERINFDCLVKFKCKEITHDCELLGISLRGALIANCTGATGETGDKCQLQLHLQSSNSIIIRMQGYITHKSFNQVGIACNEIDLESMTHLRQLVKANSSDPKLLEREIKALWF